MKRGTVHTHSCAPKQKSRPEIGDAIYVRLPEGWARAKVTGFMNAVMSETHTIGRIRRTRSASFDQLIVNVNHESANVNVSEYPVAWCWPHDISQIGGRP